MSAVEVRTVADLTDAHVGHVITVETPEGVVASRRLRMIGLRRWEHQGRTRVGITTDEGQAEGWAGTERYFDGVTACAVGEPFRVGRRRRRAS